MKHLISLIVLVQVGSNVVVNPQYVVGVTTGRASNDCRDTEIILATGTDAGTHPWVCTDWTATQVIAALQRIK